MVIVVEEDFDFCSQIWFWESSHSECIIMGLECLPFFRLFFWQSLDKDEFKLTDFKQRFLLSVLVKQRVCFIELHTSYFPFAY